MFNNSPVDKLNSYSGRLKMQYNPSDNFTAKINVQYEDSKQGGYPYAIFNDETMEAGDINYNAESIYNRKMLSTGLNLQYSAENFTISGQ